MTESTTIAGMAGIEPIHALTGNLPAPGDPTIRSMTVGSFAKTKPVKRPMIPFASPFYDGKWFHGTLLPAIQTPRADT